MKAITLSQSERTELFTERVMPYSRLIYWLCIHYSCCRSYVDDNYQEVLTELYRCIHTYDPERGHIKRWLYTVIKRVVWEMNRKQADRYSECDLSQIADDSCSLDLEAINEDNYHSRLSDEVVEALEQLSPINREALFLHLEGYKLREIAEMAHESGSLKEAKTYTVGTRVYQAKQHLRRLLDKKGTF